MANDNYMALFTRCVDVASKDMREAFSRHTLIVRGEKRTLSVNEATVREVKGRFSKHLLERESMEMLATVNVLPIEIAAGCFAYALTCTAPSALFHFQGKELPISHPCELSEKEIDSLYGHFCTCAFSIFCGVDKRKFFNDKTAASQIIAIFHKKSLNKFDFIATSLMLRFSFDEFL